MKICVYSGSNSGNKQAYAEAAARLGRALARAGHTLIYGGATMGLMGRLADAMLDSGGEVIGVIPQALFNKGMAHKKINDLKVVASMHSRKALMADLSEAFIALPGGIGTLEELFEMWTWAQLGFHNKPCALLNVAGYYDSLITFLDHTVSEAFVRPAHRDMLIVSPSAQDILTRFSGYHAPRASKWITAACP